MILIYHLAWAVFSLFLFVSSALKKKPPREGDHLAKDIGRDLRTGSPGTRTEKDQATAVHCFQAYQKEWTVRGFLIKGILKWVLLDKFFPDFQFQKFEVLLDMDLQFFHNGVMREKIDKLISF